MSFSNERGSDSESSERPSFLEPSEHEEQIDLSTLQREGLEVQEGEMTPDEALKQDHPTPGHVTGRTTP